MMMTSSREGCLVKLRSTEISDTVSLCILKLSTVKSRFFTAMKLLIKCKTVIFLNSSTVKNKDP